MAPELAPNKQGGDGIRRHGRSSGPSNIRTKPENERRRGIGRYSALRILSRLRLPIPPSGPACDINTLTKGWRGINRVLAPRSQRAGRPTPERGPCVRNTACLRARLPWAYPFSEPFARQHTCCNIVPDQCRMWGACSPPGVPRHSFALGALPDEGARFAG